MLSVYKVNKQTQKRNLNSFCSLFHLQLQGAGFSEKCTCFKSVVPPLDLKVRLLNIFIFFPLHMICPVYSAHGQE